MLFFPKLYDLSVENIFRRVKPQGKTKSVDKKHVWEDADDDILTVPYLTVFLPRDLDGENLFELKKPMKL
jgi:hypothetical protein